MNISFKTGLITLGVLVFFVGVFYLAGAFFLYLIDEDFSTGTPSTLYGYWYYYHEDDYIMDNITLSLFVSFLVLGLPFLALLVPNKRSLFGDADFASIREIKKSGLMDNVGIIVGRYKGKFLTLSGQVHALLSAPTRSGKGVGVVIPNLLTWLDSVVVLDIKQENWDITSKFRKLHGQKCYLFNPLAEDYKTHRYNPLGYISDDPNFRINDIQKIGNMLFPDKQGTDVIWTATPRSLFLGVVLLLIETKRAVNLGQVLRETLNKGDGTAYFREEISRHIAAKKPLSNACVGALKMYTSIEADNTRSGIMTGFRSQLELWMNPLVDAATSENDFDLRSLRKEKISIYIGVSPDNLERIAPLINLFFQQLIDLNTRELPIKNKELKYSCLLLMDEFTAIGKIPALSKGISYIAGYNLRMLPIIQSPSQLVETYGKEAAQTFSTNHALNIVFPPKASETENAKSISEWLGYQTVKSVSESKQKFFSKNRSPTENTSDQRRALLLPQEITSLGADKEIVVMENVRPILAKKIVYYMEPFFLNRLKQVSPDLKKLSLRKFKRKLKSFIEQGKFEAFVPDLDVDGYFSAMDSGLSISIDDENEEDSADIDETFDRDVTIEDILTIRSKKLSDFSIEFNTPPISSEVDMTEEELMTYADQLCLDAGLLIASDSEDESEEEILEN